MGDQHRAGLRQALAAWREEQADKLNLPSSHILSDSEVGIVDQTSRGDGNFWRARRSFPSCVRAGIPVFKNLHDEPKGMHKPWGAV